ncbi:MAG: DNA alkylation repair protein [Bacteroidales bacterium]|nr:DNA alkylation repair protein [Bacteroidales bacterium]
MKEANDIIKFLKSRSSEKNKKGMARFGIEVEKAFGIPMPVLRNIAKKHKKNHKLALQLWKTGYHEAMILASMIDAPDEVSSKQMDEWIKEFNSWDLCDQCRMNLFAFCNNAFKKAIEWTKREKEFERRAGFALMACLAVKNKNANDNDFLKFFEPIKKYSTDERNFVRKAVNWALRQIGKRNKTLHPKALKLAVEIEKINSKSARWIAKDAIRELNDKKIIKRIVNS